MSVADDERIPLPVQCAVYASGLFANSLAYMTTVVVPLWALTLEPSAFMIGVVLGARHFLTLLLSIHSGALMDRLGARRVMVFFAVICILLPVFYPMLPSIPALIVLQMLIGLATSTGWTGAQTLIGQVMKGNPTYAGRLSFSIRIGVFISPPIIGITWDHLGPWWAFSIMSLWATGSLIASLSLPTTHPGAPAVSGAWDHGEDRGVRTGAKVALGDLMPRLSDYIAAFRLMAIPAVVFVVAVTMLRMAGNGIQNSFYVVYLRSIDVTATEIGLLLAAASVLGGVGALAIGPVARIFRPHWLLLMTVTGSIVLVAITPLLGSFFLLLIASGLRGGTMGMSQPLMISILSRATGRESQGKSVGLRATANRLTATVLPIVMGAVVELAGLEASFLIIGGVLVALMALLAIHVKRTPALSD
jgi:MFS family permease